MAAATRDFTTLILPERDKQYLRDLPLSVSRRVGNLNFFLCHATPSDMLYEYRPPDSPLWRRDETAGADVILAGHTHLQFSRGFGNLIVVNPGSLGQSKAGDPRARYAIWEDGKFELRAMEYPVEVTAAKIQAMALDDSVRRDLIHVLRTGTVP